MGKKSINWSPFKCFMTHSTWYGKTKPFTPKGILWHDTGADNKWLKRYVQPYAGDDDYDAKIKKLGKNKYGNDWNHTEKQAGLNFWVGCFDDGSVGTVQAGPSDWRPWGCGAGKYGSLNDTCIQWEICEDDKTNKEYAQKAYDESVKLTAWLCEQYNIDPLGTHKYKGITVPNILCHWDSYLLGLGSGHDDIYDWFPKIIGKNMQNVREDVAELLTKVGWKEIDGKWYYYVNGVAVTGWNKIEGNWYFFDDDGAMQTGWVVEGDKKYYLADSGVMVTGWINFGAKWRYFRNNGIMVTGWLKWEKKWYYFDNDGVMVKGWQDYKKATYYFKKNGEMAAGEWIHDLPREGGDKRGYWYISKSGKWTYLHKGAWHKSKEKWWFGDDSGWYAKNETVVIDGKEYKFDDAGYLID